MVNRINLDYCKQCNCHFPTYDESEPDDEMTPICVGSPRWYDNASASKIEEYDAMVKRKLAEKDY